MTTTIVKLNGELAILVPTAIVRAIDLTEGTTLHVECRATEIVIRKDARGHRRPLKELIREINPASYRRHSRELGGQCLVGKEVW